ncbi:SCO4402 family protein [Microbispora sp. NPDC004025]
MHEHASTARRVQWPERRADVLNALQALGDRDYQEQHWRAGHGWPDLTAAVHWLIDDTSIDQAGARSLIPQLFQNEREADRVQLVVDALLRVLDDLGPIAPDDAYLDHPAWVSVLHAADAALQVLAPDKENP